jgi:ACT domain-containing protein
MVKRKAMFPSHCNVLFTEGDPLYLDKARKFPGRMLVVGADALIRMLDPEWGVEIEPMLEEFSKLQTDFFVFGRLVNGEFIRAVDAIREIKHLEHRRMFVPMDERWDISSTEIRAKETK